MILTREKTLKLIDGNGVCVIPDYYTEIGNYAFDGRTSLKKVKIHNSVTKIGSSAFDGCSSLKKVKIPNSVTKIGDYTFDGCTSLKEVKIPNSVTKIGINVFRGCSSLPKLGVGKMLLEKVLKNGNFKNGLCIQFNSIISNLKLVTNIENELPMFTKENAIKYCNGIDDEYWFTTTEDRKLFVLWMLNEIENDYKPKLNMLNKSLKWIRKIICVLMIIVASYVSIMLFLILFDIINVNESNLKLIQSFLFSIGLVIGYGIVVMFIDSINTLNKLKNK